MEVPTLTRFLDTSGLVAALSLNALNLQSEARAHFLLQAAAAPHRRLAQELGLPSLKILRRITGDALDPANLSQLAWLFTQRYSLIFLRHARYVSAPLIQALAVESVRHHVGKSFLIELGRTRGYARPTPSEVIDMAAFLREYVPGTAIQSVDHLHSLWAKYDNLVVTHGNFRRRNVAFPAPPWSDEVGYATALRSWPDLISESLLMRNCAAYKAESLEAIHAGHGFYFRIEQRWGMPRATLYCVKDQGLWRIGEARRAGNALVSNRHLHCLALWLAEKQSICDESLCLPAGHQLQSPASSRAADV